VWNLCHDGNMHGIIYRHIGRTGLGWIDGQKSRVFRRGKSGNSRCRLTLCSHVIIFVLPFPTAQTLACCLILSRLDCPNTVLYTVVKLLNKRWWIPIGVRPEVPKLEPEGPRAEMGFPTADQGFSSIQDTLFGFYGI